MSLGAVVVMATGHPKTVTTVRPSTTPQATSTPTVLEASTTPSPTSTPKPVSTPRPIIRATPLVTPMPPSGTVYSVEYACDQYPEDQIGSEDYIRSCNSGQSDTPVIHEQSPATPSMTPEPTPELTPEPTPEPTLDPTI